MPKTSNKKTLILICLLLAVITGGIYSRVLYYDFTDYDDGAYVHANTNVRQGLTSHSVKWAFTSIYSANWHPLTWLSLMADREIFGLDAWGFHLTNLILHILNTELLFLLLVFCTSLVWPSAFVAAAFALHPLHVESVAWIAERKDVLSTFFWMLTIIAYVFYVRRPSVLRYMAALAAFVLGLMSKPMVVTLPFVLLLLDYWPLERLSLSSGVNFNCQNNGNGSKTLRFLFFEKSPFLALSIASCIITLIAQKPAMAFLSTLSFKTRLTNALVAYAAYISKMLWPSRLAVFYPHIGDKFFITQIIVAAILLLLITTGVILRAKQKRYLPVGWFWYLGTLVPVIGLVQVGGQAMADRYTYIPLTGLFIIIAWLARDIAGRWRYQKKFFIILNMVLFSVLCVLTWHQLSYWRNDIILFKHALEVTNGNFVAHQHYGVSLAIHGNLEQAMTHFQKSLEIQPNRLQSRYDIGRCLAEMGKIKEAEEQFAKVLEKEPNYVDVHNCLGLAYADQGNFDKAIEIYLEGLQRKPDDASLLANLGSAYFGKGMADKAIELFEKSLKLTPDSKVYANLGLAYMSKGNVDKAIENYKQAVHLEPENAKAQYAYGNALMIYEKVDEALDRYEKAVKADPNHLKAHINLARINRDMGQLDKAIKHYSEVLRIEPNNIDAHYELAWVLLTKDRIEEAKSHLQKTLQIAPNDIATRCLLGDILLYQGLVKEAIDEYQAALNYDPNNEQAQQKLKISQESLRR